MFAYIHIFVILAIFLTYDFRFSKCDNYYSRGNKKLICPMWKFDQSDRWFNLIHLFKMNYFAAATTRLLFQEIYKIRLYRSGSLVLFIHVNYDPRSGFPYIITWRPLSSPIHHILTCWLKTITLRTKRSIITDTSYRFNINNSYTFIEIIGLRAKPE